MRYLNILAKQRPTITGLHTSINVSQKKGKQTLKVRMSPNRGLFHYLVSLHELWPRKDERDIEWKKYPRKGDHGQYRLKLTRMIAEGSAKPLNRATKSFLDFLSHQLTIHFTEAEKQNRNLNWLQFLGFPGVKVSKKWGGEIKVPTLRATKER